MSDSHVPLPPGTAGPSASTLVSGIAEWINSAPLRELVTIFGGRHPDTGPEELLAWLDGFSATHWDFRGGRERPEAREPDLDPPTARLVVEAARRLGMVEAVPPPQPVYQHLIVLGGLAHACLRRVGYAAHLIQSGLTVTGEVAALGSLRPLSATEKDSLATIGVTDCETEVDALEAGVRHAFDSYHPTPPVRVLAAPSGEPGVRRAHTADTQRFWAGQARLSPGDRVLVVTAPIYVPFQHCDAIRTLGVPYGCAIDTVGVDPALAGAPLPEPPLTPGRYLQEVRSAIRSMRTLHSSVRVVQPHH
ncbi:hypothetical protein ACWDV4_20800 [Micromonospora sp. NPDC003197]